MNLDIILKHIFKSYEKEATELFKANYHIKAYIPMEMTNSDRTYIIAHCYISMKNNILESIKFKCCEFNNKDFKDITAESFNRYLNLSTNVEINKETI